MRPATARILFMLPAPLRPYDWTLTAKCAARGCDSPKMAGDLPLCRFWVARHLLKPLSYTKAINRAEV